MSLAKFCITNTNQWFWFRLYGLCLHMGAKVMRFDTNLWSCVCRVNTKTIEASEACHPGGHHYYSALPLNQVSSTHLKSGHPRISTTGVPFSNVLQRLDHITGSKDNYRSNGCQATCLIGRMTGLILPALQWRQNGRDGVSNHQSHHCLINRLFRGR